MTHTLPIPPSRGAHEDTTKRGLAILQFVIRHRITATVADDDLQAADHAGLVAVSGYSKDPGFALATIQEARDLVSQAIRTRAAWATGPVQETTIPSLSAQRTAGGPGPESGRPVVAPRGPQPGFPPEGIRRVAELTF